MAYLQSQTKVAFFGSGTNNYRHYGVSVDGNGTVFVPYVIATTNSLAYRAYNSDLSLLQAETVITGPIPGFTGNAWTCGLLSGGAYIFWNAGTTVSYRIYDTNGSDTGVGSSFVASNSGATAHFAGAYADSSNNVVFVYRDTSGNVIAVPVNGATVGTQQQINATTVPTSGRWSCGRPVSNWSGSNFAMAYLGSSSGNVFIRKFDKDGLTIGSEVDSGISYRVSGSGAFDRGQPMLMMREDNEEVLLVGPNVNDLNGSSLPRSIKLDLFSTTLTGTIYSASLNVDDGHQELLGGALKSDRSSIFAVRQGNGVATSWRQDKSYFVDNTGSALDGCYGDLRNTATSGGLRSDNAGTVSVANFPGADFYDNRMYSVSRDSSQAIQLLARSDIISINPSTVKIHFLEGGNPPTFIESVTPSGQYPSPVVPYTEFGFIHPYRSMTEGNIGQEVWGISLYEASARIVNLIDQEYSSSARIVNRIDASSTASANLLKQNAQIAYTASTGLTAVDIEVDYATSTTIQQTNELDYSCSSLLSTIGDQSYLSSADIIAFDIGVDYATSTTLQQTSELDYTCSGLLSAISDQSYLSSVDIIEFDLYLAHSASIYLVTPSDQSYSGSTNIISFGNDFEYATSSFLSIVAEQSYTSSTVLASLELDSVYDASTIIQHTNELNYIISGITIGTEEVSYSASSFFSTIIDNVYVSSSNLLKNQEIEYSASTEITDFGLSLQYSASVIAQEPTDVDYATSINIMDTHEISYNTSSSLLSIADNTYTGSAGIISQGLGLDYAVSVIASGTADIAYNASVATRETNELSYITSIGIKGEIELSYSTSTALDDIVDLPYTASADLSPSVEVFTWTYALKPGNNMVSAALSTSPGLTAKNFVSNSPADFFFYEKNGLLSLQFGNFIHTNQNNPTINIPVDPGVGYITVLNSSFAGFVRTISITGTAWNN